MENNIHKAILDYLCKVLLMFNSQEKFWIPSVGIK